MLEGRNRPGLEPFTDAGESPSGDHETTEAKALYCSVTAFWAPKALNPLFRSIDPTSYSAVAAQGRGKLIVQFDGSW